MKNQGIPLVSAQKVARETVLMLKPVVPNPHHVGILVEDIFRKKIQKNEGEIFFLQKFTKNNCAEQLIALENTTLKKPNQ